MRILSSKLRLKTGRNGLVKKADQEKKKNITQRGDKEIYLLIRHDGLTGNFC